MAQSHPASPCKAFAFPGKVSALALALAGCGLMPHPTPTVVSAPDLSQADEQRLIPRQRSPLARQRSNEVVIFALGLIETGYSFGGKNPEAGLDCSGMVSYVFDKATGVKLKGSAADLARKGRLVSKQDLEPGDVVFFNTTNRPNSHVGIYIGDGRFIHAPNSRGKVRTESLASGWFAARFEAGRTFLD